MCIVHVYVCIHVCVSQKFEGKENMLYPLKLNEQLRGLRYMLTIAAGNVKN